METKTLGASGLRISSVGLGCINFGLMCDQTATDAVVNKALDLGVTFFDTSNTYGGPQGMSESMLAAAIGARRHEVVIATKFGGASGRAGGSKPGGGSRQEVMQAVDNSLKALQTDYIDLYQIHFPDTETPLDETMRALGDLTRQGKIRYAGCSNFPAWMVVESQWLAKEMNSAGFISVQNRYSLLKRDIEDELVPAANTHGVGVLPYFPLESGLLTGKVKRGENPPEGTRLAMWSGAFVSDAKFDIIDKLNEVGAEHRHTLLDYAIGWLVAQPHVGSVIAGATKPEQLEQNVAAAEAKLSQAEMDAIAEITSA